MSRTALISQFMALYPDLRSRLRGALRSQDLADEALNETWLRLSQGGDVGVVRNARAYLSRMAMNIAIDRKRAGARLASAADIDALFETLPDSAPGPDRIAIGKLELQALERAIAQMPPRRRAILAAARLDGRSCKDIAETMKLSKRTVETELRQALDHCADYLMSLEKGGCVNPGPTRLDKRVGPESR